MSESSEIRMRSYRGEVWPSLFDLAPEDALRRTNLTLQLRVDSLSERNIVLRRALYGLTAAAFALTASIFYALAVHS